MAKESPDKYHVIMFGRESEETKSIPLPYTALGHISEEWKLAVGYSAADMTILPTLEDNLPNVILESSACGTPVIAFDSGGVSDAILPGVNGQIMAKGNISALASVILNFKSKGIDSAALSLARKLWHGDSQAVKYLKI